MHIVVTRLVDRPTLTVPGQPIESDSAAQITAQSGDLTFALTQGSGDSVTIRTVPPDSTRTWKEGTTALTTAAALTTTVAALQSRTFTVERAGSSGPVTRAFYFHFDSPGSGTASMSSTPAVDKLSQNC